MTPTTSNTPSDDEVKTVRGQLIEMCRSALRFDLRADKPTATRVAARQIVDHLNLLETDRELTNPPAIDGPKGSNFASTDAAKKEGN